MAKGPIIVLAGVNGAGKSSVGGAHMQAKGATYFNPDTHAKALMAKDATLTQKEANSLSWNEGYQGLLDSIASGQPYIFETTLGGHKIPAALKKASEQGIQVKVWYVGLESADLHVARVKARVKLKGHDIPEQTIRERYVTSQLNLIDLMPGLDELQVFDNSVEAPPETAVPAPKPLLHMKRGKIIAPSVEALADTPAWAKPIVAAAMKIHQANQT